jgi:transcriptional regulator with XRE-family HTH domain
MKRSAAGAQLPIPAEDALVRLGERVSVARRARLLTQADLASRAGVGVGTVVAIEAGRASVQIGFYASVLFALDLLTGFDRLAALEDDPTTLDRLGAALPERVRFSRARG